MVSEAIRPVIAKHESVIRDVTKSLFVKSQIVQA
jgi:hypothetical protein